MKNLVFIVFALLLTACSSMPPSEVAQLTYESNLTPVQIYELFTGECGTKPKNTGWTNGPGNGFGIDAKFDEKTNSATIVYYHISFGERSDPGSFWDKTFGQSVLITETKNGAHVELHGETAAHLMRNKYKEIGTLLAKTPTCHL